MKRWTSKRILLFFSFSSVFYFLELSQQPNRAPEVFLGFKEIERERKKEKKEITWLSCEQGDQRRRCPSPSSALWSRRCSLTAGKCSRPPTSPSLLSVSVPRPRKFTPFLSLSFSNFFSRMLSKRSWPGWGEREGQNAKENKNSKMSNSALQFIEREKTTNQNCITALEFTSDFKMTN